MKRNFLFVGLLIFCLGVVAQAQQKPRTAMFRYQSKATGEQAVAAGQRRKAFIDSKDWNQTGQAAVGYVYTQQAPGATPLLEITRPVKGGTRYFYSTDFEEANALMKADSQWKISDYNNGKSCYVSATKKPGTIPVYLYSQPSKGLDYLYIFGDKENNAFQSVAQKSGINFEKIAFYVWEKPVDTSTTGGDADEPVDKPAGGGGSTGSKSSGQNSQQPPVSIPGPIVKIPAGPVVAGKIAFVDFSMRGALYLNGAKTDAVDTTAKYAPLNGSIVVKKSESTACGGEFCTFNLGFVVFRGDSSAEGDAAVDAVIEGGVLRIRRLVEFKAGEKSKQLVVSYKLKMGGNTIYVSLDPLKKINETDENNNNFRATVVVEP